MFVRLAVILIATVLIVVIGWQMYLKTYLPYKRRKHIEQMERENAEMDRIINVSDEHFKRRR